MNALVRVSFGCIAVSASHAVTIDVDASVEHQTMEGFGFFGYANTNWGGIGGDDAWFEWVIRDMGLTISRQEYYSDEGGQDTQWGSLEPYHKRMKAASDKLGIPVKFICSIWSPPSNLKTNSSLKNGGHVKPDKFGDLAQWLKGCVTRYKNAGIDLYGLSIQNEPAFAVFYNSCQYTAEEYMKAIKLVSPAVKEVNPDLKLFGVEDMANAVGAQYTYGYYRDGFDKDPAAKALLDIMAVHGYSDGVNPDDASRLKQIWSACGAVSSRMMGKPLWMTETSGYGDDWTGSMGFAEGLINALKYGQISAWVHWYGQSHILNKPNKEAVFKAFARTIRPDAVMVDCNDGGDALFNAAAFNHKGNKSLTIVMVNSKSSAESVTLSGDLPAQFKMYLSNGSNNFSDKGNVSGTISVPAKSVVALQGGNYNFSGIGVAVSRHTVNGSSQLSSMGEEYTASIHTADGRLVRKASSTGFVSSGAVRWNTVRSATGTLPQGAYFMSVTDKAGKAMVGRKAMAIR